MITDTAVTVLRFAYLLVLWAFVLSTISLLRKDIFRKKKKNAVTNNGNVRDAGKDVSRVENHPQSDVPAPLFQSGALNFAPPASFASSNQNIRRPEKMRYNNVSPGRIVVLQGISQGDFVNLSKINPEFEVTIGRGSDSMISLPDSFVSTHHSRIFLHQGDFYLEDLNSTNGTELNGKLIHDVSKLSVGDQIRIGKNVLEVE